jgi:LPS sulfotransferase NodH
MKPPPMPFEIPDGKNLFVILAMMRSGSNLLQQTLNAIDGILCHGEIFNSSQSGLDEKFEKTEPLLPSLKSLKRNEVPVAYLNRLVELSKAEHVGFRLFESHNDDLIVPLIDDARIFKIILIRDFLESYVSLEIARQTNQWIVNNVGTRKQWKPIKVSFDAFKTYALRQSLFYYEIATRCMLSGQKFLALHYSCLNHAETEDRLCAHFGRHREINRSKITAQRQNPEPLEEKIANFREIQTRMRDQKLDRWLMSVPEQ